MHGCSWRGARFFVVVALLGLAACAQRGASVGATEPSEAEMPRLVVSDQALSQSSEASADERRFTVAYSAQMEDSCSQSWALTRWNGTIELAEHRDGRAEMTIEVGGESTGGSWSSPGDTDHFALETKRCEYSGHAHREGDGVWFSFDYSDGLDWDCRPVHGVDGEEANIRAELRCRATMQEIGTTERRDSPRARVELLQCELVSAPPYLLHVLGESGGLPLSDDRALHLSVARMEGLVDTRAVWVEGPAEVGI